MAIRNNQITHDRDGDRFERLQSLSTNIDTFAGELGITGDRLTWAQGAVAAWTAARTNAGIEEGEKNDAFEDLHNYVELAAEYYATAREMLLTIIYDHGGKPDDFIERYGIKGATPRIYNELYDRIDKWLVEDARLKALVPPDPRVVPDGVTAQLTTYRDTMYALYNAAYAEKGDSDNAFDIKHNLFAADSSQLTFVLMAAKLVWGDDDYRLRLLGFCPSSEIWTHNKPYAPKNLAFDSVSGTFSWDAVEDVDSYQLDCRLTGKKGDWTNIYEGAETSTVSKPPTAEEYDIRCRAIAGDVLGNWCTPITVDFTEE